MEKSEWIRLRKLIGEKKVVEKVVKELGGKVIYIPKKNYKVKDEINRLKRKGMDRMEILRKLECGKRYLYKILAEHTKF